MVNQCWLAATAVEDIISEVCDEIKKERENASGHTALGLR